MHVKEIGGYLELERFSGSVFHEHAIALNSGRACLEYLLELRQIDRIWLPDWLCGSVSAACFKHGVEVNVYSVGDDMRPEFNFEMGKGDWLYLVDYYGQLDAGDFERADLFSRHRLIVDEAQAFFRRPQLEADTLYTCRKFFGVSDGAYLYTKGGGTLTRQLPVSESYQHMQFVLGRFERTASEFFAESKENNKRFASEPVSVMSSLTENVLRAIDYKLVREVREENYRFLDECLSHWNLLDDLKVPEGPYMYPLLVDDASSVRAALASEGVFIPILWPNCIAADYSGGKVARAFSKNILPLPVDQRYGKDDMRRVVGLLEKYCFN